MTHDPNDRDILRVMVLGDSHGNIGYMIDALELAAKFECDVLHVVGDFGFWTHVQAGVDFLDNVETVAESLDVLVTFTDGNHENFADLFDLPVREDGWREVRPRIWHAPRGHMWRWGKTNFLSMGGAHSIDGPGGAWRPARGPGNGWWPEETITEDDVQTAIETMVDWAHSPYPDVDVMFTHDCPSGIPLPFKPYPAGQAHRDMLSKVYVVAQPRLLIHGHYHHSHVTEDTRDWGTTVIGLSHDAADHGQFCFLETDPLTSHKPN